MSSIYILMYELMMSENSCCLYLATMYYKLQVTNQSQQNLKNQNWPILRFSATPTQERKESQHIQAKPID